jgi:hypothetical protein
MKSDACEFAISELVTNTFGLVSLESFIDSFISKLAMSTQKAV